MDGCVEYRLSEIFESVCGNMKGYAAVGTESLRRLLSTSKLQGTLTGLVMSAEVDRTIKAICEDFFEDFEEKLVKVIQRDPEELSERICVSLARFCTSDELKALLEMKQSDSSTPSIPTPPVAPGGEAKAEL